MHFPPTPRNLIKRIDSCSHGSERKKKDRKKEKKEKKEKKDKKGKKVACTFLLAVSDLL